MLKHTPDAPLDTDEPDDIDEPIGPTLYDTALTPEEGLWHRSGWTRSR